MSATIKCEILGGTAIGEAYDDCRRIGLAAGVCVECDFNGVAMFWCKHTTKDEWLAEYDKKIGRSAQPPSDPAAQSEVAAAPAEPAAGPETSAPPREMTKEEAIVALCRVAKGTDDPSLLRAICLGCKALARDGIHKRRNRAARSARGKEAAR